MHRTLRAAALVASLAATLVAPGVHAQDAAPSIEGHPFVGAWLVDTNTDHASEPPSRLVVHADGTLLQVDQTTVAIGVWAPTDEDSVALTITAQVDIGNQVATMTVRGVVDVAADGAAWAGQASVEQVSPDGTASGQMGPIPASATRIVVEPLAPTASPSF